MASSPLTRLISIDVLHSRSFRSAGLASLRDEAAPGDPRMRASAMTARGHSGGKSPPYTRRGQ